MPLLNNNGDVLPDLREPIIISKSFNNSVGSLYYSTVELVYSQGLCLIILLNFEEVLCIGKPDNFVKSLNNSSDSFEYVFLNYTF